MSYFILLKLKFIYIKEYYTLLFKNLIFNNKIHYTIIILNDLKQVNIYKTI